MSQNKTPTMNQDEASHFLQEILMKLYDNYFNKISNIKGDYQFRLNFISKIREYLLSANSIDSNTSDAFLGKIYTLLKTKVSSDTVAKNLYDNDFGLNRLRKSLNRLPAIKKLPEPIRERVVNLICDSLLQEMTYAIKAFPDDQERTSFYLDQVSDMTIKRIKQELGLEEETSVSMSH